jgi:glyoxylase-like metal-dependent hydrolase (beta-lactamase superfamily II)
MQIGNYKIESIVSSRFRLDGGAMFGVVPKPLWEKENPSDERNRIAMVTRNLLIAGEGKVILIDTGNGGKWDEKGKKIYAMEELDGLQQGLKNLGYGPEDVTHVINTHLHFDHCGGNTYRDGHELKISFPNAQYIVHQRHLEWANNPTPRDKASFFPENWEPLIQSGQLHTVDREGEILPGIFLHLVNGHTPYQILPRISDGETTLLFCGDLIPLAAQTRIPWVMGYDLSPLQTVQEKQSLLEIMSAEKWWLSYEHDPKIAFSQVEKTEKGFVAVEKQV